MRPDESRPLIDYLVKHATRPQFVYRHQWQADTSSCGQPLHHAHRVGDYQEARPATSSAPR